MRTLGNILWHFPFFGFVTAIFYWLLGLLLTVLVVTAPLGLGLHGVRQVPVRAVRPRHGQQDGPEGRAERRVARLFDHHHDSDLPFGLIFVVLSAVQVFVSCISIIGIPVALVIAKSLGTVLNPVNKVCVPSSVRDELARRQATADVAKYVGA